MGRYRSLVVLSGFQKRTNDVSHQNQACQFQVPVRTSCVLNNRVADCGNAWTADGKRGPLRRPTGRILAEYFCRLRFLDEGGLNKAQASGISGALRSVMQ